jgi:hypothetical protein
MILRLARAFTALCLAAYATFALAASNTVQLSADGGDHLDLVVRHASFPAAGAGRRAVDLRFADADAGALKSFFKKHLGERVRASIGGTVVLMPTVRAVPERSALQVTVDDDATLAQLRAAFADRP